MKRNLHISKTLSLPPDAVTSTIVVYGGKGMGKTNLASVLVEEFAAAGLRFAVIDPMGVWWGLRYGADGKRDGIKVLILGGIHGDLPITPESGALVADLVVDEDASVIIDVSRRADGSMWAIAERIRFVRDYAKRIYQRQGEKRRPIHQVIDEAARFAPQIVRQGENEVAACMGAIAVLVEEGRNVGIGVTLVTQRSARLNKDVAELADCMISFRIVGPNSMRAVLDWLGEHVEKSRFKEIGEKLRSLPRGSALVVSPGWLEFEGIVAMRMRETFDSSATPKAGKTLRVIGGGAVVDLSKYRERLAELIEQQKATDPKALKARILDLEKQLAKKGTPLPNKVVEHIVEKPIASKAMVIALERSLARGDKAIAQSATLADRAGELLTKAAELMAASGLRVEAELGKLRAAFEAIAVHSTSKTITREGNTTKETTTSMHKVGQPIIHRDAKPPNDAPLATKIAHREMTARSRPSAGNTSYTNDGSGPSKMERTFLTVLAQFGSQTKKKWRILADYRDSGPVSQAFARMRANGWTIEENGKTAITNAGLAALGDYEVLPTGSELRELYLAENNKLSKMERAIFKVLCDAYPSGLTRGAAREATGYKDSGPVSTAFAHLVNINIVTTIGRELVVAPELFE